MYACVFTATNQDFGSILGNVGVTVEKEGEFPQMLRTPVALVWQVSLSSREK